MKSFSQENLLPTLLVGEYQTDQLLMREVFRELGWRLFEARDRRQALRCLEHNPVQVVITESDAPGWNWKSVLQDLLHLSHPPHLIVTSRIADEYLWAEVLNIGGYDVLARPFDRDELERVVASAHRHFDFQPLRAKRQVATSASNVA